LSDENVTPETCREVFGAPAGELEICARLNNFHPCTLGPPHPRLLEQTAELRRCLAGPRCGVSYLQVEQMNRSITKIHPIIRHQASDFTPFMNESAAGWTTKTWIIEDHLGEVVEHKLLPSSARDALKVSKLARSVLREEARWRIEFDGWPGKETGYVRHLFYQAGVEEVRPDSDSTEEIFYGSGSLTAKEICGLCLESFIYLELALHGLGMSRVAQSLVTPLVNLYQAGNYPVGVSNGHLMVITGTGEIPKQKL